MIICIYIYIYVYTLSRGPPSRPEAVEHVPLRDGRPSNMFLSVQYSLV